MAQIRSRLNLRGLNKLMTSPEVQAKVDEEGARLAQRAGKGFEYTRGKTSHPHTARGYVQPQDAAAMRRQARDAVLERALGGNG